MDKSTKQLLTRISALQESVKDGKKLCLESAAIIKVQRDMIEQMAEALAAAYVVLHPASRPPNGGWDDPIPLIEAVLSKLKDQSDA